MKRKWTVASAVVYLIQCGAEMPTTRTLVKPGGWNGLKACSAMDFLIGKGYKVLI